MYPEKSTQFATISNAIRFHTWKIYKQTDIISMQQIS